MTPDKKALTLVLVATGMGAPVHDRVSWAPFLQALTGLCDEIGIEVEYDAVDDQSVALFWQPREQACRSTRGQINP
jgi:hypothetical protein